MDLFGISRQLSRFIQCVRRSKSLALLNMLNIRRLRSVTESTLAFGEEFHENDEAILWTKSWDKLALLALLRTCQVRRQLHLTNPDLHPYAMLKTSTCNFNIALQFQKLIWVLGSNFSCKTQVIRYITRTFVHDCRRFSTLVLSA